MRYVVDSPAGQRLQGVKSLTVPEVEYFASQGFKLRAYKDDRLSRAASAVWNFRMADPDPMGDPSGDLGDAIAAHERSVLLRAVADAGYDTPGEYNEDLRSRMVGPDGKMSYRVHELLSVLEILDVCERCGSALNKTSHYTKQYGGGWDTFYHCSNCDYSEVYV